MKNKKRKVTNRSNKWKQWFVGNTQKEQEKDMATYYFTGKCNYAKVYKPDLDFDKINSSWKIDLYMDDESWELFNDSGCQLKVKEDKKTGEKYVNFRRPTQKLIKDKIETFKPPVVVDKTNSPMTADIGNGSTVTVKVEIYNTRKGKGHTLEAVRVEELVPYEANKVVAPDEMVPF